MKYNTLLHMRTFAQVFCLSWLFFCGSLATNAQTKGHFSDKRLQTDTSTAGYDGPYIFYNKEKAIIKQIIEKKGQPTSVSEELAYPIAGKKFICYVNDKEHFSFKVQELLQNQPSVYAMPEKLIAISDIEGRFEEFKDFLIANKVMDKHYKWTFGKGHLVTVGDFFDRGLLVTQTLWLIYSLEEQAEKAGGKVHFILGNHDLMNMNNDFRYVRKKYLENAKLMGQEYYDFYKPNTELGRWLATKNILEKIGDYIFVHAGISKEVSDLNMGVEGINKYARRPSICLAKVPCGTVVMESRLLIKQNLQPLSKIWILRNL